MSLRPSHSGFEPRTRDPERRDFFDLRRRLAKIEGDAAGGGSPFGDEVLISPDDPGVTSGYELWYDTDASMTVPWTAMTLLAPWVNYGSGYQNAQYRKVGDMVYLRGLIKSGTVGAGIWNIPAGHHPPTYHHIAGIANDKICNLRPGGGVLVMTAGDATQWVSLDNCYWSVTA